MVNASTTSTKDPRNDAVTVESMGVRVLIEKKPRWIAYLKSAQVNRDA
jgi:hypothetical protein